MAQNEYYPEDVLVGKMQSGEYGWLDYVNHFSADWQEEYARYCDGKRRRITKTIRLWRYERIPIPGRWTCSPKCAIC